MMTTTTTTGSRTADLLIFAGVLAAMLVAAPNLRAYFRITPTRVSVVAHGPEGAPTPLETPAPLAGVSHSVPRTFRRIEAFAHSEAGERLTPPGGRLEWTIHHSENSLRFDEAWTFETRAP